MDWEPVGDQNMSMDIWTTGINPLSRDKLCKQSKSVVMKYLIKKRTQDGYTMRYPNIGDSQHMVITAVPVSHLIPQWQVISKREFGLVVDIRLNSFIFSPAFCRLDGWARWIFTARRLSSQAWGEMGGQQLGKCGPRSPAAGPLPETSRSKASIKVRHGGALPTSLTQQPAPGSLAGSF